MTRLGSPVEANCSDLINVGGSQWCCVAVEYLEGGHPAERSEFLRDEDVQMVSYQYATRTYSIGWEA